MSEVLLDSSTLIDLERANRHRREDWAVATVTNALNYARAGGKPFISVISILEVMQSLKSETQLRTFRTNVEQTFTVVDIDLPISYLAANIASDLRHKGLSIGLPDTLIAESAIHKGLCLATANEKHFHRVIELGYDLKIDNWRRLEGEGD